MVQLTRIYTKGGDTGKTSLGDGSRVKKSCVTIQGIGEVDEVNCVLGVARLEAKDLKTVDLALERIQNDLFDLGADLCIPQMESETPDSALRIQPAQVLWLEAQIDDMNKTLKPLNSFVLPGGSRLSAYLHLARATTRRAERAMVAILDQDIPLNPEALKYLNRLSDYLFVLSRHCNNLGVGDVLWIPGANRSSE